MISYEPLITTLKSKGIDIGEVSKMAGIKASILVNKMNAREYISMEMLDRICNVLGEPVESVIKWSKGKQRASERINVDWDFIQQQLLEKGMSLNELSEKCRLNKSALSHAKNRNSQLKKWTVHLMAEVLDVPEKKILRLSRAEGIVYDQF